MSSSSEEEASSLDTAIQYWTAFLKKKSLSSYERLAGLDNLANALCDLADETGDAVLADRAVAVGKEALTLSEVEVEGRLTVLSDVSTVHLTRFELRGEKADLDEALRLARSAAEATPTGHSKRCARYANLANTLCTAFEAFGARANLGESISASEIAITGDSGSRDDKARALSNKGRALGLRYEYLHVAKDIYEAIEVTLQAETIAEDPLIKATCSSNVVGHMISLAERHCSDETVNQAIEKGRNVCERLNGPVEALCAHNLSYLYRLKYERVDNDGDPNDLQIAVDYATDAINTCAGDQSELAKFEDNLAICLEQAYKRSPSNEILALAIQQASNAVSRVPGDHPSVAAYSIHLADMLRSRLGENDLDNAIQMTKRVLHMDSAPIIDRIAAGQACGSMLLETQQWNDANSTLQRAVDLVPRLAKDALQRADQQYVLGQLTGLSSLAASAALQAGQSPADAFEVLERGRAVLMELAITSKTDLLPGLEAQNNEITRLMSRYDEIKQIMSRTGNSCTTPTPESVLSSSRIQLSREMTDIETSIHTLAALQSPGLCQSFGRSLGCLEADYAVAFNTTSLRSDAFILSRQGTIAVPLPSLKTVELAGFIRKLLGPQRITKIRSATYRVSNQALCEILSWLWFSAVRPVFEALGLLPGRHGNKRLPRVCWITSGAMGLMPLHAAGEHTPDSVDFAMNYAISSYAVSFRALEWSRKSLASSLTSKNFSNLTAAIMTMEETPGKSKLPGCKQETQAFSSALPSMQELPSPSAERVQSLLPGLSIAHFACHAEPDAVDPSNGALLLYDSTGNVIDRLSIYTLAETNTSKAWLAFLSACQTADQQNLDFLDEAIHIAGAFHIAGFPQVIGTLWQAEDEYASSLASAFYGKLSRDGHLRGEPLPTRETAVLAHHEAVLKVRSEDPECALSWAPFVIFGA